MIATSSQVILVAEDEPMVGMMIVSLLESAGFGILGPVATAAVGLALLFQRVPTAAVLDITLRGGPVFPLADALQAAAVPYLFISGNTAAVLPAPHRARTLLAKPFRPSELLEALSTLLPHSAAFPDTASPP